MGLFLFGHISITRRRRDSNPPLTKNMYVTLQNRQFSTSLEADVHVWIGLVGATLLDKRLFALYALPVADKRLA